MPKKGNIADYLPGAWKVTHDLVWKDVSWGNRGLRITDFWHKQFTAVVKHSASKFEPTQTAKVAEDVRGGLQELWEHLASLTGPHRGGTAIDSSRQVDGPHAAYIWQALRKQAYRLFTEKSTVLSARNMTDEVEELIKELHSDIKPGTAAMIRVGGRLLSPGEERDPLIDDEIAFAVGSLNDCEPMSPNHLEPWMEVALRQLHGLVSEKVGGPAEIEELNERVVPNPKSLSIGPTSQAAYETERIDSLWKEVEAFASPRVISRRNPISKLRLSEPDGAISAVDRKGKGKMKQPWETSNAGSGRALKRSLSTGALSGAEQLAGSDERIESLSAQCKNVWDSSLVMQAAIYAGKPVSDGLCQAIERGMWEAADLVDGHEEAHGLYKTFYSSTIKDLDSIVLDL